MRRHWAQNCDESPFILFRIDNRIPVRRLVVEAMNEDCTHGNVAHGCGSVHVWGGISYGINLLVRSGSGVIGAVYHRVLEEHLVSRGRAWYRRN